MTGLNDQSPNFNRRIKVNFHHRWIRDFCDYLFGIRSSLTPYGYWTLFVFYGLYYAATEGIQKAYIADLVPLGNRGKATWEL
jgi:hypothetical protein